jgi:hypothetical protein
MRKEGHISEGRRLRSVPRKHGLTDEKNHWYAPYDDRNNDVTDDARGGHRQQTNCRAQGRVPNIALIIQLRYHVCKPENFHIARGRICKSTCTQNAQEKNEHHVKNATNIITANLPLALVHRESFMIGGGDSEGCEMLGSLWAISRYLCHTTKITIRKIPRIRRATMSNTTLDY